MVKEKLLQELLQKKRSYESLLALNSAGKHKSSAIESMVNDHLKSVIRSIEDLKQHN